MPDSKSGRRIEPRGGPYEAATNLPSLVGGYTYSPELPDPAGQYGVGIFGYWRLLRINKRRIVLTSIVGAAIGLGVGVFMKPVYRASTSIELLNLNEDFMNMKQTNPVTTGGNMADISEAETQIKLLQSKLLLDRVSRKLNPAGKTAEKPTMATTGWRSWFHLHNPVQVTNREQLLSGIAKALKVRIAYRTRIIEATVESSDPELAAQFVNTLIQEYIQENLDARRAATLRTRDWLNREIDEVRGSLKNSEDSLQAYARGSGLIFTDKDNNVAVEKLQQLQQQLSAATADRIGKQARFELARNSPPNTVAEVLSDQRLKDLSAAVNTLQRQVADLNAVYTPEFSQTKRVQAELAVTEKAFERTRADIMKRIQNDYEESINRESLLATVYDAQTLEVAGQDKKAIQYNILKRDAESSRLLYDAMLQQAKQSAISSALRPSNIRVVDLASVPDVPFFPNFKLNSAAGLFAGLLFGIASVTLRHKADRTVQQPGDLKLWTDLAELGSIPSTRRNMRRISAWGGRGVSDQRKTRTGLFEGNGQQSFEMVTRQDTPNVIAEAFRSTLASILFLSEKVDGPRVIVVTSPHPEDGKTTVVSNLAIAAAEIGRKILIIDADMRRPRMHSIFDVPNDRGLSNWLHEESTEDSAELVRSTAIPNLFLLPAGSATNMASHLLYSAKFSRMLAKSKNQYDMIIIDTPPMLIMSDARVVARLADAAVLVMRSGHTTRDAVVAARQRLNEDAIQVLGTVLTEWNPDKSLDGYYGQHHSKLAR